MTIAETRTTRQTQTSKPDPYTLLPILITPSVLDRAVKRFPHHFSSALAEFKQNKKGRAQRQVWKEFRDAVPNEIAAHDRAFLAMPRMAKFRNDFKLSDGSDPEFLFRQNRDILFVCVKNYDSNQLAVIYPAKVDPISGRPVLEGQ